HVAKLAGLPAAVINRAQAVLYQLEQPDSVPSEFTQEHSSKTTHALPHPHPIIDEVKQIDLFSITPLDAMNRLADLQRLVNQDSGQAPST
ncbi:MAG: hypothetical protein OEU68_10450, partial [Nitrospira sp.]|nr:hypothetical protein [Nitrospira sp.]